MAEVKFHYKVDDSKLSFAVIIARMNCRWVLCKHKDRTTYEFPGGHREVGESIEKTARRELQEETGAVVYSLEHVCDYSVRGVTRQGEELDDETFGTLFFAQISYKDDALDSEIEKVELVEELPDNLTYPLITPRLIERAMEEVLESETGTAYFLVYDENFRKIPLHKNPFIGWLKSEGFKWHNIYHSGGTGIWVNLNNKTIACGKPGIRCFEEIGHHAITIDEFKVIYGIYKKYRGKRPFVLD